MFELNRQEINTVLEMVLSDGYFAVQSSKGGVASRLTIRLINFTSRSYARYSTEADECTIAKLCGRVSVMPRLCPLYILNLIM
jgi:hypothetical protein